MAILALLVVLSIVHALPIENTQKYDEVKADSEVHNREVRPLTDGLRWHLDRIDQRGRPLDGKYCPIGKGISIKMHINIVYTLQTNAISYMYIV